MDSIFGNSKKKKKQKTAAGGKQSNKKNLTKKQLKKDATKQKKQAKLSKHAPGPSKEKKKKTQKNPEAKGEAKSKATVQTKSLWDDLTEMPFPTSIDTAASTPFASSTSSAASGSSASPAAPAPKKKSPPPTQPTRPAPAPAAPAASPAKKRKRGKGPGAGTTLRSAPLPFSGKNAYLQAFERARAGLPADMHRIFDSTLSNDRRSTLFDAMDLDIAEKYAWAVPDRRALRIISAFGPVVEIGCGRGYWGSLLKAAGVAYAGYDLHAGDQDQGPAWCKVKKGGPENIADHQDRALLLCYPDDFEDSDQSLALECFERYTGDTIIYIGEVFGHTMQDNPWGKTAGADFLQELAASFHPLVRAPLPSWPVSWDQISVWRRTKTTQVDDMTFKDIPADERVDLVMACPATQHLLEM